MNFILQLTEAIKTPLGLVGASLGLMFVFLTRHSNEAERKWLTPIFVGFLSISLVGGIFLLRGTPTNSGVKAETHGNGAPIIIGNDGEINQSINVNSTRNESNQNWLSSIFLGFFIISFLGGLFLLWDNQRKKKNQRTDIRQENKNIGDKEHDFN